MTAREHSVSVLICATVALSTSAVASAPSLERWALRKSDGPARVAALWLVSPALRLSRATRLYAARERAGGRLYDDALPDFRGADPREPADRVAPVPASSAAPTAMVRATSVAPNGALTVNERRFDARRPLRVWVAGDSMAFHFGLQLDRMARRSGVMRVALDSQPSTGLIDRGDVRWLERLRATLDGRRPDVFVLSFGANDADVLRHRGVAYAPGHAEWREGYRERARAIMELVGRRRPTYWLGMPVMRSATYLQKITVMNSVFVEESARVEGVRFIDTVPRYSAPDGSFTAFLPDGAGRLRLVRMEDGIHYTPEGARQLSAHVFEMLCDRFIVGGRCP